MKIRPKQTVTVYGPIMISRQAGRAGYRVENEHGFVMEGTAAPGEAGFNPAELLCSAVGTCLAITVDQMCARQGIDAGAVKVAVSVGKAPYPPNRFGRFMVSIDMDGIDDPDLRDRLIEAAQRHCTVSNTLDKSVVFEMLETGDTLEVGAAG